MGCVGAESYGAVGAAGYSGSGDAGLYAGAANGTVGSWSVEETSLECSYGGMRGVSSDTRGHLLLILPATIRCLYTLISVALRCGELVSQP